MTIPIQDQCIKELHEQSIVLIASIGNRQTKFVVGDKHKATTIGQTEAEDLCLGPIKAHTAKDKKSSSTL